MQSELHEIVVYHGVEVLVPVSMLFLLAIPKSFLTLKEFYILVLYLASDRCSQIKRKSASLTWPLPGTSACSYL